MIATVENTAAAIESREKPVLATGELADELDVSTQHIRDHTDDLEDSDKIGVSKAGSSRIYWVKHKNGNSNRLDEDMRIREARQVVAKDHNMDPDDVSLQALLKVTASAYCGYQQTSDWRPENGEKA